MSESLQLLVERLEGARGGAPLVRVACAGELPPGSAGAAAAHELRQRLREVLAEPGLGRVILDLRELRYEYGDALAGCLCGTTLGAPGVRVVTVAGGATALALRGLLDATGLERLGARLCASLEEARALLA